MSKFICVAMVFMGITIFISPSYAEKPNPLSVERSLYENPQWEHMSLFGDGDRLDARFEPAEMHVQEWERIGVFGGRGIDKQGVPYVIAGPNFYHLSGFSKRDAVKAVDITYGLTGNSTSIFRIRDWDTGAIIGTYGGEAGLVLQ